MRRRHRRRRYYYVGFFWLEKLGEIRVVVDDIPTVSDISFSPKNLGGF